MNKLKTLEDIKRIGKFKEIIEETIRDDEQSERYKTTNEWCVKCNELKAEAIKWVNDIKANKSLDISQMKWATMQWIINFFNLTEKDLKEEKE